MVGDDEHLKLACGGDADALTELLKHYGPIIRQDVARQIPRRWQALLSEDDVMQQTYADAFRSIRRFKPRGEGSFAKWLVSLARCNARDAIKMLQAEKRGGSRRRIEVTNTNESMCALYEQLATSGTSPSQHAARAEATSALSQAIQGLQPTYHQVVQMYDLEGRPMDEVAQVLKRSPGAVYMLRARAHDQLREELGTASQFFSIHA